MKLTNLDPGELKMQMNKYVLWGITPLTILLLLAGGALSSSNSVFVNIMIDINALPNLTTEQKQIAFDSIVNLTNGVDPRGLNVTLFPTGEAVPSQRLHITYLANASNYEVAMGGMNRDETMGKMSSSDQKSLLNEMKRYVEACHICRGKTISPAGFKPQSFDQNNETYVILNQMGILYDAGFKAGIRYMPGHENDTWPYRINNLNIYAIPVSTYGTGNGRIYLSDRFSKEEKGFDGSQWYSILQGKFDESARNGDPVVVIFDNEITGMDGEYLRAYLDFIDYALSKNATFVSTGELVKISKKGRATDTYESATDTMKAGNESGCAACDAIKNASLNASLENTTASADLAVSITPSFKE